MPAASPRPNYKSGLALDKSARQAAVRKPNDLAAVEAFLHLLGRAVRQFHTYPSTSQPCTDAIEACHRALASLERDRLMLRVRPTELILEEVGIGSGTVIEQEVVRRLHRAHVAAFDVGRIATSRHLSHFCTALIQCDPFVKPHSALAELLEEQGVETIVLLMAHQPEVLDVGAPSAPLCDLIEHERQHQASVIAGRPVDYLYPPDKGWVRLDPAARLDQVSLVDLALLVDNPVDLAAILLRLTDDDHVGTGQREIAFERKFADVTMLFASLDPRLAGIMFEKLSRAVLGLEPDRRQDLLRRTILPGLLDGNATGAVLRDFPDADLADSLCILLELEAAAPEVLSAAIDRLELTAARRDAVIPLIDARLRRGAETDASVPDKKAQEIDRFARRLIRVETASGKSFSEFSAFDLAMDDQAMAAIVAARSAIAGTDLLAAQLGCLASLVRLETSPVLVEALLRRTLAFLAEIERRGDLENVATWAANYRQIGLDLKDSRPDVADAIAGALTAFLVPSRVMAIVDLHQRGGDERRVAGVLIDAFAGTLVPGVVALVDDASHSSRAAAAVGLLCEHAQILAPALVPELDHGGAVKRRAVIKALGCAGAGHERVLSAQLTQADDQTYREALRALVRTGTTQAAAFVARQLQSEKEGRRVAAEDALWRFSPGRAVLQARRLLRDHEFVTHHPRAAGRLLDRVARVDGRDLADVLAGLAQLRVRFWSPDLVRLAFKARELQGQ